MKVEGRRNQEREKRGLFCAWTFALTLNDWVVSSFVLRPSSFVSFLLILSFLHVTLLPAAAQELGPGRGALNVSSAPSGLAVYVDDMLIGTTPIPGYAVAAGRHAVRVVNPNPADWDMRDWVQEVTVGPGETVAVHAVFVGVVTVVSVPFDANVYVDGVLAGTTPLRLRNLAPGLHEVAIQKRGYERMTLPVSVSDTTRQTLKAELKPSGDAARRPPVSPAQVNPRRSHDLLGAATLGTGLVCGGLALIARHRANQAYDRYQRTGDPVELERFYQQANRNDRIAGVLIGAAQVNFLASFYFFFVSRVFRSDGSKPEAGR